MRIIIFHLQWMSWMRPSAESLTRRHPLPVYQTLIKISKKNRYFYLMKFLVEIRAFPLHEGKLLLFPFPKPGKDPLNPSNYRPIALTSCLCKIMERMVKNRLVWYLEVNDILTKFQASFRKNRSANDQLVHFESLLRDAFINKDHVVSIFFELEKAYNTALKTWCCKRHARIRTTRAPASFC